MVGPSVGSSCGRRAPPRGCCFARADGDRQEQAVGDQFAGRVGLFVRVDDFDSSYERMREAGVEFVGEPREEPYGRVAIFLDVAGNRWDLLGPAQTSERVGATVAPSARSTARCA